VSDFFEDVRQDSIAALARHGVTLPPETEVHLAAVECFHLERRLIRPVPRRVLWSRQLQTRHIDADDRAAIESISAELERGVNVGRRMTKTLRKAG
jgi:hypothetical protein